MKNFTNRFIALFLCLSGWFAVHAFDFEVDGIFYNITDDMAKEVEVTYKTTDYNSYFGVVNIPSTVSYNDETYTVTSIGESAFRNCLDPYIEAVTIPNTVTEIKSYAFYGSKILHSLTIGASITSIASNAFGYNIPKAIWLCNTPPIGSNNVSALINYVSNNQFSFSNQKVYPFLSSRFEVDNVVYVPVSPSERTCDVIDCNYASTSNEIVIDSIVSNQNIEMKVLNVNDYSFWKNNSINKVTLRNNGYIGNSAFYKCTRLVSANLSNNGYIGVSSFNGCESLNSVTIGNNVSYICDYAFYGCSILPKINIPDNITNLGKYSFANCSSLNNISIGRGIPSLPEAVFSGCSNLPSIYIPSNIGVIDNYVFSGCENMKDITFEEQRQNITETQYFPDWTSTNHSNSSSSSHEYSIDVQAGDVLSFEIWSDSEGYDILTVYLNGTSIAAISGIGKSQTITKAFSNTQTISLKVEYNKDDSESFGKDEAGIRNIMLNNHPHTIILGSNNASPLFSDCPLDEVVIGRKLSYNTSSDYGYSPFYRNTSLRSVKISDIEDTIYDNEFYGCSNLQEFECGDGVTSIGNWAFSGCSALESYNSGSSVESIGQEAFSDCTALTSFTSHAAVPPVCGNQALDDINKWTCILHVPSESIDDYKAAEQWKEFFFIEETGVEEITIDNDDSSNYPVEIYNLSGVKIGNTTENLAPGLYIKRQGRKVEKIKI